MVIPSTDQTCLLTHLLASDLPPNRYQPLVRRFQQDTSENVFHQNHCSLHPPFIMSRTCIISGVASIHSTFESVALSKISSKQHSLNLGFFPSCIIRNFFSITYLTSTMITVPTFAVRWPAYLFLLIVPTKDNAHLQTSQMIDTILFQVSYYWNIDSSGYLSRHTPSFPPDLIFSRRAQ